MNRSGFPGGSSRGEIRAIEGRAEMREREIGFGFFWNRKRSAGRVGSADMST